MSIQRYRLLNAILLAALVAGSAWAYPRLPSRIPMHFDLAGQPDRWEARSVTSWFLLPAIACGMALMLYAMSALGTRTPHLWNLPEKRRFLALHPRDQAPVIARMQRFIGLVGVMITALFGAIQAGIYHASLGDGGALPVWITASIVATVLGIGIAAARLNGEVGRMVREADARTAA